MKPKLRWLCRMVLALCFLAHIAPQAAWAQGMAGAGFVPRPSALSHPNPPSGTRPLGEGIPAGYTPGFRFAVWGDMLAFCDEFGASPVLRVHAMQGGELVPVAAYAESAPVIDLVLDAHGLAYLTGDRWTEHETTLVTISPDGTQHRVPLGSTAFTYVEYPGSLARLTDGRLLLVDGDGTLRVCEADGSGMRQVTDAPVRSFAYSAPYVYFTHLADMAVYEDVYSYEYGEYLDVPYPRLYRTRLDGTDTERMTEGGVRGLAAWGPHVLYQDIDDAFVWPYGELPEEWLCGRVARLDTSTGQRTSLGLDSGCYYLTAYGPVAWVYDASADSGGNPAREGYAEGFALVLHDWYGNPLCRLAADPLLWWEDMVYFAADDALWVWDYADGQYTLSAIPLDGSDTRVLGSFPGDQ